LVVAITFLITIGTVIIRTTFVTKPAQHLYFIKIILSYAVVRIVGGSLKSKSFPLNYLAQSY